MLAKGFFDETATIQLLTEGLEKLFNKHGWETKGRVRSFAPVAGDSYRKKFADVTLFSSKGSDNQIRNFGVIESYGGGEPTMLGQEPTISQNSVLGFLGEGDDSQTEFHFPVKPVVPGSEEIYVGGNILTGDSSYTVDYEAGVVTLTTAAGSDEQVRATYQLTDNAPDMPSRLWFFTYDGVREEQIILQSEGGRLSKLGTGDGSKTSFNFPADVNMKNASAVIYNDGLRTPYAEYTVDYTQKTVTFSTAPASGAEVTADYVNTLTKDADLSFGDLEVPDFDPTIPSEVTAAVYSGLNFIYPSVPTAVSFIPDEDYGFAWTRNSQMFFWGNVTQDRIVMYLRADPAPDPEKTYFAPLYIGRLSTIGRAPQKNNIIIGGAKETDQVTFTPGLSLGGKVLDYGSGTSNGNTTVQLQQSIGGAYYQSCYLAFITHDVSVDQSTESRFNPSVYSGKFHISPMYIVHPVDGYVGRLDEVYAIHPKNIAQLDELEVTENTKDEEIGIGDGKRTEFHLFHSPSGDTLSITKDCKALTDTDYTIDKDMKKITFTTAPLEGEEVLATYDYKQVYRFTLADTPITPFVLANATPYNPIGLGMLKENL